MIVARLRSFPLSWCIFAATVSFDVGYWLGRLWA